jgi:hypothetical protein
VVAAQPGPDGNVNAQTITIMPTPPTGIQGVFNAEPTANGKPAESDDQLRERARFHLERLGNATLNAIKFAVLEIDGVEGVEVTDHTQDSAIPLGEVHVSYTGSTLDAVSKVVEDTRAAGILAVLSEISVVLVNGVIFVLPDVTVPGGAADNFKNAVVDAINAVEIGKPLSTRKLVSLVFGVSGLADVAEAQLASAGAPIPDPFLVKRTELVRPDVANLTVTLLSGLHVAAVHRAAGSSTVDLQVTTAAGVAIFISYSLDLTVSFRARLKTAPDAQPSFIGALQRKVTYTNGSTASFSANDADIPGYDSSVHDAHLEITITSTAYPGLPGVDSPLNLT